MNFLKLITALFILAFSSQAMAQTSNIKTIKFNVDGVCGMCKDRIETALDMKGIKYANWDKNTHICEVTYRTDKVTDKQIYSAITAVGHDTEKLKASDEAYSGIHGCCKYRSEEVQKSHEDNHE